jgi:hypothetical protein
MRATISPSPRRKRQASDLRDALARRGGASRASRPLPLAGSSYLAHLARASACAVARASSSGGAWSTAGSDGRLGGGGPARSCRRGLNMSTTMSPKMMSSRRKMHFRRPVFFWYLRRVDQVSNPITWRFRG